MIITDEDVSWLDELQNGSQPSQEKKPRKSICDLAQDGGKTSRRSFSQAQFQDAWLADQCVRLALAMFDDSADPKSIAAEILQGTNLRKRMELTRTPVKLQTSLELSGRYLSQTISFEELQEAGRKGGAIQGPKNVENGHLKKILPLAVKWHKEHVEENRESGRKLGQWAGRLAAERGQCARMNAVKTAALAPRREQVAKLYQEGKTQNEMAQLLGCRWQEVASDVVFLRNRNLIPRHPRTEKSREGAHKQWHVRRGIVKQDCEFCCPKTLSAAAGK